MILAVIGGVIIIALGLAVWYDHRAKRRGLRVGASTGEALQHRMDVDSVGKVGQEDPMTWRKRRLK